MEFLTYKNGEWVPREDFRIQKNGSFDEAVATSVYRNGSWESIFAPGLLYMGSNDSSDSLNAFTGLDGSGNPIGDGGIYGGFDYKTDGLILNLDATKNGSYPGTGNTWYDLSGNDHHAKGDPDASGSGTNDSRFPVYENENGGRFYFDGSRGLQIESDMGSHTTGTHEMWFYRENSTNNSYIADGRNSNGDWWLTNYSNYNINVHGNLRANDPETYQSNSNWWEEWKHVVVTGNGSSSKLFIDGVEITDSRLTESSGLNFNLGTNFRVANRYNSSVRWSGYFGQYRIYDHELTATEVNTHYENTKSHYL